MYTATSLVCDFLHTEKPTCAMLPQSPCTEPLPPLSLPCVMAGSALGSVSWFSLQAACLVIAVAGASARVLDVLKKTAQGIGCRCKFSELHLLTEIKFLLHHHLREVPKPAQSFHMLCNSSPPLSLQDWLGVWQGLCNFSWGSGHPGTAAEAGVAQGAQTRVVGCGDSVWWRCWASKREAQGLRRCAQKAGCQTNPPLSWPRMMSPCAKPWSPVPF